MKQHYQIAMNVRVHLFDLIALPTEKLEWLINLMESDPETTAELLSELTL